MLRASRPSIYPNGHILRTRKEGVAPLTPTHFFSESENKNGHILEQKMSSKSKDPIKLFTMKIPQSKLEKYKYFAKYYDLPLSQLIQKLLEQQPLPKRVRQKPTPKVDPELIRQLSAIGNNLNQVSRRVNQGDKIDVISHLVAIENQLEQLLNAHQIH